MLLKSVVTSYYFAVLVTQTTEVKTLFFSISHNFKTDAKPCLQTVSRRTLTAEDRVRGQIIPFGFRVAKKLA